MSAWLLAAVAAFSAAAGWPGASLRWRARRELGARPLGPANFIGENEAPGRDAEAARLAHLDVVVAENMRDLEESRRSARLTAALQAIAALPAPDDNELAEHMKALAEQALAAENKP